MVKTRTLLLTLFFLTTQATAFASEATTDVTERTGEPAANPKNELLAGDHMLSNGTLVAVVGASPRPHLDAYGFPTANASGSILDFGVPGAGFNNSLMIGSPVLSFESRLIYPVYSSVEGDESGSAIHAVAK